jgi:hypothetical protein
MATKLKMAFLGVGTESLTLGAGSIWGAIVLDYPYHSFSHLGLYYGEASFFLVLRVTTIEQICAPPLAFVQTA